MLRRVSELVERALRQLTWLIYYYTPIALAYLTPGYRSSDIREEITGSVSFDNGKYAIYVLWQPFGTVPWYVMNMLNGLKDEAVNTVVVANHRLTAEQISTLEGLSAKILVRNNKGLDFGAYRDGIQYLTRKGSKVTRLLLVNDSVYVFNHGLNEVIEELVSDRYPVVAAYENWELHYHFQSFCIAYSGEVFRDPKMIEFWNDYLPISIRRWCINQGEVRLSRALRKIASRYHIIYDINELVDALAKDEQWATILQYREFIPRPLRQKFPGDEVLDKLDGPEPNRRIVLLRRLREHVTDLLMLRAQSHTGVFLFPKFLDSPFLKRDIVYRELFTIYEVERMLKELGHEDKIEPITDEIRRRGTAAHLEGFARRRYQLGLI